MGADRPPEFDVLKAIGDPFERRLYFAAVLTKYAAERGGQFVIVGGHAVEYYTGGSYTTGDLDLLTPDKQPLAELLVEWGFQLEGRIYWHAALQVAVDLICDRVPGDWDRIAEVEAFGLRARIMSVEEMVIDRLNAAIHWRSTDDLAWARVMLTDNLDAVDWDYLSRRAKDEQTTDALARLRREVRGDD